MQFIPALQNPWGWDDSALGFFYGKRDLPVQKLLILAADLLHLVRKGHLPALMEPKDLAAHLPHLLDGVGDQDGGGAAVNDLLHFVLAFFPEGAVAHGEHLVQNEDIRVHQAGDGEGQAGLHAGGELFKGPVLEFPELGKVDDLVVGLVHKLPGVAQHGPPEVGILPDGQVSVEAAAQLQQGGDGALPMYAALGGLHDAGDDLQKGRLARAVGADDTQHVSFFQGEGHVPVGPELHHLIVVGELPHKKFLQADLFEIAGHIADGHVIYL